MTDSTPPTNPKSSGGGSPAGKAAEECPRKCPSKVEFSPKGKKWGWDDFTDSNVPWMSVQTGKSDTVTAKSKKASHADRMCNVTYESSDDSIATVSPKSGSGDNETLTIEGKKKGEVTITASCKGGEVGKFKVAVKDLKKVKMMIRQIDHKDYTSTSPSKASVEAYLNKIYKQAVTEFTVTKLAAKEVNFDTDKSGDIDVKGSWPSADVTRIVNAAGDASYDYMMFYINKPNDGSNGWSGYNNAEKSGVVHADNSGDPASTTTHETGHGLFGLAHEDADTKNIMLSYYAAGRDFIRKHQWDKVNP
jgi:hypothetical protein